MQSNDYKKGTKAMMCLALFPLTMKTKHTSISLHSHKTVLQTKPYAFLSVMSSAFHKLKEGCYEHTVCLADLSTINYILNYVSHIHTNVVERDLTTKILLSRLSFSKCSLLSSFQISLHLTIFFAFINILYFLVCMLSCFFFFFFLLTAIFPAG